MTDRPDPSESRRRRPHLQCATWIRRCDHVGTDSIDVGQLAVAEIMRRLGLDQVVDAGAPAADLLFRERQEFDAGHRPQQIARGLAYALRMREVAGIMVGDPDREGMPRCPWRAELADDFG